MTDLHCPATVILVTDATSLSGMWLAGVFRTPRVSHGAIAVLAEATDIEGLRAAIDLLADLHRGETLAVVATSAELSALLPAARTPPITLTIDASGWSVASSP